MLYVSIFVELLRSRPALAVWIAAVTQGTLWTFVPSLFYGAPPGDVPLVIAVGHEFALGSFLGPPLASWLSEIAFDLAGKNAFGVYLLSQLCVAATYRATFSLGRSILGAHHAAMAVLLMVGILSFSVPTPAFGPAILAMPLWALVLLHYWLALRKRRLVYWLAFAIETGLLLLTTYAGLLLAGLIVLFTLVNRQARSALGSIGPWIAVVIAAVIASPHLFWLADAANHGLPALPRIRMPESAIGLIGTWFKQIGLIIAAHAGVAVILSLAAGWPWAKHEPAPLIVRAPIDSFARQFVYFFAIAPALAAITVAALIGSPRSLGEMAPLVILSGAAVILTAGDKIELARQHVLISAWFTLLLAPPAMAIIAMLGLPWLGIAPGADEPAPAVARYFAESFQRRIGAPLRIIAGDPRTAALIAMDAPSRPSLFLDATPERSPWVTVNDVRAKGAIIVWPTTDTSGTPPPDIQARFPDIVPELPQGFERPVQGRLPLVRIGWALIRPEIR
jgi:4-amino-4-deoxy-L-arabinose transferase-like glycosyltransferase